ncbi:MAG: RnfABCDGE type electron transport complex subunit C, partial [Dehalococcoidaceae bacterium]|nr:RnfABCDGE type electron transport complex subunit C [Dehalococcoidaceae bacterium]
DIVDGIKILQQILKPENTVIAVNDSYIPAIGSLNQAIISSSAAGSISLLPLKHAYPGGAEELLVKTVCKREIRPGKLPQDAGVSVHNVSSVKALNDAVCKGLPFVERVVTVTGKVRQRKNLKVRLGTPVSELLDYCGGTEEGAGIIILGGPMMGKAALGTDVPVNAMLNCVIAGGDVRCNRESPCIRCGRCIEVCPVGLSPVDLFNASRTGNFEGCKKARIDVCFECGNCSYICPSGIDLVQYIKVAKRETEIRKAADASV